MKSKRHNHAFMQCYNCYSDHVVTTVSGDAVSGSHTSGRQSSDAVKGYKSVTFRPTSSPSSLPSTHAVKHSTDQQTDSSSVSEQTANGM